MVNESQAILKFCISPNYYISLKYCTESILNTVNQEVIYSNGNEHCLLAIKGNSNENENGFKMV